MKKGLFLGAMLLLAVVNPLLSKGTFEGQYDMKLTGNDERVDCTFWVKDGNMRMKVSSKGQKSGEMIFPKGSNALIMIVPQQKMYMEMAIPSEPDTPDTESDEPVESPFTRTGETRKILGYDAHEFLAEGKGEKMVIWATEELGSMPYSNNPILEGWANAMKKMTGLSAFFPLETIGYDGGRESYRMVVTKVEEKALPDAMFLPPKGYMKFDMPAGMGGFMPKP
jgi:hypothetical protein